MWVSKDNISTLVIWVKASRSWAGRNRLGDDVTGYHILPVSEQSIQEVARKCLIRVNEQRVIALRCDGVPQHFLSAFRKQRGSLVQKQKRELPQTKRGSCQQMCLEID